MDLIRIAIDRPIAVLSAVLMCVLFGLVALQVIPIQLTPDVNRPVITIRTSWPGAAPAERLADYLERRQQELTHPRVGPGSIWQRRTHETWSLLKWVGAGNTWRETNVSSCY